MILPWWPCAADSIRQFYLHLSHELLRRKGQGAEKPSPDNEQVLERLQPRLAGNPDLLRHMLTATGSRFDEGRKVAGAKQLCRKLLEQETQRQPGRTTIWRGSWPLPKSQRIAIRSGRRTRESRQSRPIRNLATTEHAGRRSLLRRRLELSNLGPKESISLGKGGNSSNLFFLAMAHWQLDDKDEARTGTTRPSSGWTRISRRTRNSAGFRPKPRSYWIDQRLAIQRPRAISPLNDDDVQTKTIHLLCGAFDMTTQQLLVGICLYLVALIVVAYFTRNTAAHCRCIRQLRHRGRRRYTRRSALGGGEIWDGGTWQCAGSLCSSRCF